MKIGCMLIPILLWTCFPPAVLLAQDLPSITLWAVDPLEKVFRDAEPRAGLQALAEVARGEHASLQVVVRCPAKLIGLRVHLTAFVQDGHPATTLQARPPRFVGYVPIEKGINKIPPKEPVRRPPADFPDPLLEMEAIDVDAGQAQPIWITVPIPLDASPGLYKGQLNTVATVDGREISAVLPTVIRVYGAEIKRTRLWITNWLFNYTTHSAVPTPLFSEEYWAFIRRYARNMADHRQNVALLMLFQLVEFRIGRDGRLEADFSHFDRMVNIFMEEGVIGLIEGSHIGGRKGSEWTAPFVVTVYGIQDGQVVTERVDPDDARVEQFYGWFFPTLVKHLREKGWLDIYLQHLTDEPIDANAGSYCRIARKLRPLAPELRFIDAVHSAHLAGCVDVWVPQLNFLHRDYAHYQQRQQAGEQVWFYTCLNPQGEYANRFIELPLLKVRLLHWINFRYGITGYLHWGYNAWQSNADPFKKVTRDQVDGQFLPAGDSWIVYPGKDGPLDSIRFEAMRDGIVDHELLSQWAERDRDAAMKMAAKHILDFDRYNTDIAGFRASRREMLDRLSQP